MNRTLVLGFGAALITAALLAGCREPSDVEENAVIEAGAGAGAARDVAVPRGTEIDVRMTSTVSTLGSQVGDEWDGVLLHPVTVKGRTVVDEGAVVHGEVRRAAPPSDHDRATLVLTVTSIEQDGRIVEVPAATEPIVAGTPRATRVGAVPGGADMGPLLANAVVGARDARAGGMTGLALTSRRSHVELRPGTQLAFQVSEQVAWR